mgnify:CR=1 FL=1
MVFNEKKLIYSWISFHGITDILLPIHDWILYYSVIPLSIIIPIDILNYITIILSSYHFANDIEILNPIHVFLILSFLVSNEKYNYSQPLILSYMSIVHVPLHLYSLYYDIFTVLLLVTTYISFYKIDILMDTLDDIIKSSGRKPNNMYHSLLLGVINAHIVTNLYRS